MKKGDMFYNNAVRIQNPYRMHFKKVVIYLFFMPGNHVKPNFSTFKFVNVDT